MCSAGVRRMSIFNSPLRKSKRDGEKEQKGMELGQLSKAGWLVKLFSK
jgi:hypothetical protein